MKESPHASDPLSVLLCSHVRSSQPPSRLPVSSSKTWHSLVCILKIKVGHWLVLSMTFTYLYHSWVRSTCLRPPASGSSHSSEAPPVPSCCHDLMSYLTSRVLSLWAIILICCGARNQKLILARQLLYHRITSPTPNISFFTTDIFFLFLDLLKNKKHHKVERKQF